MTVDDFDARVRAAAFDFVRRQCEIGGGSVERSILMQGFSFDGRRVPLLGPAGIFKPAILPELPLSITTVPVVPGRERPYDDAFESDDFIRYRYRGTDPNHPDNRGLRLAMSRRVPLLYFYGLAPGEYLPIWPVKLVRDDPTALAFWLVVDSDEASASEAEPAPDSPVLRSYFTRVALQRAHQKVFQRRVLFAYKEQCAVCRLRHHRRLLDAAHILEDKHPRGDPIVSNGLALCKLHHAAFDGDILGVRPDLRIEIREDVLAEEDGPMLVHGLQQFQGKEILEPRSPGSRPSRDRLEERFARFRKAV
ncbi:MAG: HNH endonuclease [Acidobacteria bacterium]|nr:HNH endonuclease [Acidobacteriota bacterium]